MPINSKITSVGIWGIVAMILMGVSAQVPAFPIDWTADFMNVPLGGLVVLAAGGLGGWLKKEPTIKARAQK